MQPGRLGGSVGRSVGRLAQFDAAVAELDTFSRTSRRPIGPTTLNEKKSEKCYFREPDIKEGFCWDIALEP